MLACFVSAQPRRGGALDVAIVEAAGAAEDVPSVVGFLLLVDAPAAASETLNAFVGQPIIEAANAGDTVSAGMKYAVLSNEPASAAEAYSATGIIQYLIEAASADTALDAVTVSLLVARHAMVDGAFINSAGTPRQAQAADVMVNL